MNFKLFPNIKFFLFVFILLFAPGILNAQISYGGEPIAKKLFLPKNDSELFHKTHTLSEIQSQKRNEILTESTPPGQAMRAGFSIPVYYSPEMSGMWHNLGDSLWIWRLKIEVEKANSIGLVFKNFSLSDDSNLFIYNADVDFFIGAFTHKNNNPSQLLSVQVIPGETVIIEYSEKIEPNKSRFSNSFFAITEIIYIANGLSYDSDKNLGNSDYCMINVNCSEGDQWKRQKRGVARLLMRVGNSWFWCSGSLINTTAHDGTPYLLTADHCGFNASIDDMNLWQFYFNFERPGCDDFGLPLNNVLYGSTLISNAPLDGGSDFKLVLLHQRPPIAWRPYYNGWNNLDIPAEHGVGIHHPSGDAKKISTFMGGVNSGGGTFNTGEVMADNSAWRFSFVATENGHSVTQGGSSGSPMFNQDGLIVGTLSGGSSSCSNPSGTNIYGKMSYHWTSNHDHPAHKLAPYLDPLGTNLFFVRGYDPYIDVFPAPGFVSSKLLNESQVEVRWLKPGHAPNNPGWHGYTSNFTGNSNDTPERATVFDAAALGFNYPVTISKLSHVFRENHNDNWENDEFTFKIYGSDGMELLYTSPSLTAVSLEETIYELDSALTFEDKFYVAVRPSHLSGHPSSVYNITNLGNSFSYVGHSSGWEPIGDNTHQFVFLTKVFVENDSQYPQISDKNYEENLIISNSENYSNKNEWISLVTAYKIFRNDELIVTIENEPGIDLSFIDNIEGIDAPFIKYYLKAVYDNMESSPSNSTYVFTEEYCGELISEFPYLEIFDNEELPPCWITQNTSENGWITKEFFSINENNSIEPFSGNYMMLVEALEDEVQDEWLLSPAFDVSELQIPALRFYFNGNFSSAIQQNTSQLNLYISDTDNSFYKIWDVSDSPTFIKANTYSWIPVVINIKDLAENGYIRFGFQYEGEGGDYFAIDNFELFDASDEIYNLSISMFPFEAGEVYGEGSFIGGEAVNVTAYANTPYFFHFWSTSGEHLTHRANYRFLMPENNYFITANFTLDNVTSADEDLMEVSETIIYPNPTTGKISIRLNEQTNFPRIEIFNSAGSLILRREKELFSYGEDIKLDISDQPSGLYFIFIHSENKQEIKKVSLVR